MKSKRPESRREDSLRERAEERLAASRSDIATMPTKDVERLVHELQVHQIELEMQNEELRRAQLELEEARDRYLDLYDFAPVGYVTLDADGVITEANLTVGKMLGAERSALVGHRLEKFVVPEDQDVYSRHYRETLASTLPHCCQVRFGQPDGATLSAELESAALRGGDETVQGSRSALLDITERKRIEDAKHELEERLRQTQKMEAIGRLAGGVAHDFNNILTAILGHVELLRDGLTHYVPSDNPLWKGIDRIQRSAERATELTAQLLAFGHRQVIAPVILSPAHVLANTEEMLRRLIREDVELHIACDSDTWRVKADPGQIQQVLLNLALNARDALPRGGRVTIQMSNVTIDHDHASNWPGVVPGPHVLFAVSDNGVGMDDAALDHIFEPFYTTKEMGKGTGLGLATVYAIVQQSNGHVAVESRPGQGSTFRVYWPATTGASLAKLEPAPRHEALIGDETVLVCEDDEAVRELSVQALRSQGYTVLPAANGHEALQVAERQIGPIDMLVTDVIMPGVNGRELAATLTRAHPSLRTLLVSGHAADIVGEHGILDAGLNFLQKPFSSTDLARRVRQIMDG